MNNELKLCFFLTWIFILCGSQNLLAKTEQEMLDEHTKWIEILDLSGCDATLTQVFDDGIQYTGERLWI